MGGGDHAILPRPPRRQRPTFVLTSLIDVIFLLVIFFMVTSQITPFSLIPLGPVAGATDAPATGSAEAAPPIAVTVQPGAARIGGKSIPLAEIGAKLADLKAAGADALVLIPTRAATVQDVVSVLEAVRANAFGSVTVLNRNAG